MIATCGTRFGGSPPPTCRRSAYAYTGLRLATAASGERDLRRPPEASGTGRDARHDHGGYSELAPPSRRDGTGPATDAQLGTVCRQSVPEIVAIDSARGEPGETEAVERRLSSLFGESRQLVHSGGCQES
jgi:hypothetical protein